MDLSTDRSAATAAEATLQTVQTELSAWRARQPQATFAETEAAVEAHLGSLRAALIGQSLPAEPQWEAAVPGEASAARPQCPACGVPLDRRGRRRRQVRVLGDEPVSIARQYWTCPQCGGGHFPPR